MVKQRNSSKPLGRPPGPARRAAANLPASLPSAPDPHVDSAVVAALYQSDTYPALQVRCHVGIADAAGMVCLPHTLPDAVNTLITVSGLCWHAGAMWPMIFVSADATHLIMGGAAALAAVKITVLSSAAALPWIADANAQ